MTPVDYAWIGFLLFTGTILQGAVGFGMGLYAVPLMILVGIPLETAVAVVLTAVMAQTAVNCWQTREHIPWRKAWLFTAIRAAMLPPGLALLYLLSDAGQSVAKQTVGCILLIVLIIQTLARVKPRQSVHLGWDYLAASTSGLMNGALGMGGPPLVLWVMAHDWPTQRTRAFLWINFLLLMPLALPAIAFTFGKPGTDGILAGLIATPLVVLGSLLGLKLGERLSRVVLRRVAFTILFLIATAALVEPWVSR